MHFLRLMVLVGGAVALMSAQAAAAPADAPRPPPRPRAEIKEKAALDRFCEKVAPSVEELRIAAQRRELEALDKKVKERIDALEKLAKTTQEWIEKRENFLSKASQNVVAIFSKGDPESAAKQLDEMQDDMAAAILAKLPPQRASAILSEMNAAKAGKIVSAMRGDATNDEKKL